MSRRQWAFIGVGLTAVFCLLVFAGPVLAQESGTEPAKQPEQNIFFHIIKSAGIVFAVALGLPSIALIALVVLLMLDLRMSVAIPPGFVDEFIDTVNKRRFKEAFDMARSDSSFLGRVLTAGMSRLQYGIEDARECAMHQVESVKASKEQLNNFVATIGTLGPLVGLVGTVFGMIESFRELSAGGQPRPEKLAAGISHALVVTLFGIALSVPAIFCHTLFKNRLTRIQMDVANLADDLLTQMYHNSRRAASGTTPNPDARTSSTATQAADPRAG
jgi:biopolymer transport protein ExbB